MNIEQNHIKFEILYQQLMNKVNIFITYWNNTEKISDLKLHKGEIPWSCNLVVTNNGLREHSI